MIQKYCITIFLFIVFIIILLNLKENLYNSFKNNSENIVNNNTIEKFDDGTKKQHILRNIDKAINKDLADDIKEIYDTLNDNASIPLKNNVKSLYNRAKNLYDKIGDNKKVCEKEYEADYHDIIDNYDTFENQKCLTTFSDILNGKYNLADCAKRCDNDLNCLSFSHDKSTNDCRLSTICHNDNNTTFKNYNNNLYIKTDLNLGSGAYIRNYKLDKDKQCNNLCHNDIIDESEITKTVHDCAERCEEKDSDNNKCASFEYNFTNKECTLRKECQQGTHLINSNEYKCDKGQIKNANVIDNLSFDINRNRNLSNKVLDYYSELELKKKCNKKCDVNVECDAFTYEFTPTSNNCTLYQKERGEIEIEKDMSEKFNNICVKPTNSIKKNLYTKKDSIPETTQCQALCEENVNKSIPYIKFYKEQTDINYSYISFGNMYNVKELPDFNISEYKYIGINYGYKISFLNNENYVSLEKVYKNPDDYNINIDELKVYIHDDNVDDDKQWRNKINVILIEKLGTDCRGEMGRCQYNQEEEKYEKKFSLFYDDGNDLQKCRENAIKNFGVGVADLYFPSSDTVDCENESIDCSGYWTTCIPDTNDENKYKKTWIENEPINGSGTCIDIYNNNIYSDGISGCGSGPNENIKIECNPNNNNSPFLVDGSYYKQEIGSDGTSIDKYYGSDGTEITNAGSSIGVSVIPDAGSGNVC